MISSLVLLQNIWVSGLKGKMKQFTVSWENTETNVDKPKEKFRLFISKIVDFLSFGEKLLKIWFYGREIDI